MSADESSRLVPSSAGSSHPASGGPGSATAPAPWLAELLGPQRTLSEEALSARLSAGPVRIGSYELRGWIGQGGMGTVLDAYDADLARPVALKLMTHSADPAAAARFRREAQALARLDHPGIVRVFDFDELEGVPFLVMERVRGRSLEALLAAEGPLPEPIVWQVLEQAAEAMEHAQAQGVLHRDLKPSNLLWVDRTEGAGEGEEGAARLRICDFGLARVEALEGSLTGDTTRLVGSLPYMSPEQRRGEPVDARSDMCSLGITLYRLLTGELPGSERLDDELARARPETAPALKDVIGRLARARRDERPFSWRFVRELLRREPLASAGSGPAAGASQVLVPGGTFVVGHEGADATAFERPRVQVSLSAFRVAPAPFRVGQLLELVGRFPDDPALAPWAPGGPQAVALVRASREGDGPVTGVTWFEAAALAHRAGGRLPFQVEWEVYTRELCAREPGASAALYALQEWCEDWVEEGFHGRLAQLPEPATDPRTRPSLMDRKVVVGAGRRSAFPRRPSWFLSYPPDVRRPDLGFRVVVPGSALAPGTAT